MDLAGKVAVVTGASRGIGRAIANELLLRGANVAFVVRTVKSDDKTNVGKTSRETKAFVGKAIVVRTDLTKIDDLNNLIATTVGTFGRLDILVNSAADIPGEMAPIESHTRDGWLRQFDVNLHAPFSLIGLSIPHMRQQGGGIIINLTSGAADLVQGDLSRASKTRAHLAGGTVLGYAATKAALNRLSNVIAAPLARDNIAIVCVNPGFTKTESVENLIALGLLNTNEPHSVDLPVSTILEILTLDDPMKYTGQIVRTVDHISLVSKNIKEQM